MGKTAVVLGAGASRDAWNGSTPLKPEWTPPLARDLFSNSSQFWSLTARYPRVRQIWAALGAQAQQGTLNLEEKLREYAFHPNPLFRASFKYVPLYLRDLLHSVSRNYVDFPSTHSQLVQLLLEDPTHEVAFITLNYDDFLERALEAFNPAHMFRHISDYIDEQHGYQVFKLHGSIDWYAPIGGRDETGADRVHWDQCFEALDLRDWRPGPIHVQRDMDASQLFGLSLEGSVYPMYPVLTAPLAGKSPEEVVCPHDHVDALRSFLQDCRKFLVLGCSGLDEDLLQILGNCINESRVLHVVAETEDAVRASADRFQGCSRAFQFGSPVVAFGGGFRGYVGSDAIREFMSIPGD